MLNNRKVFFLNDNDHLTGTHDGFLKFCRLAEKTGQKKSSIISNEGLF